MCVYSVYVIVLINILTLKLGPETKILSSTPSKVNDDVETLLFSLRTTLDLIGFFFFFFFEKDLIGI